jgi:D-3-phosphoglycerate dehydrogenase
VTILAKMESACFRKSPGIDVDVKTGLEPDALKAIIPDYDALVIRSATKVTEDLLERAIASQGVGVPESAWTM